MKIEIAIGLLGWILALIQFILNYFENKKKNDDELLEKTLSYFEKGMISRPIAISLIEAVWFKKKKYIDIIVPVLISQITFLLTDAENYHQEERNLIRLLYLLNKCLPYSSNHDYELHEISDQIISAAVTPGKLQLSKPTLRHWFAKFNNSNTDSFDAETLHINN